MNYNNHCIYTLTYHNQELNMTIQELSDNVRQEFDRRNLKSDTRYNALKNVMQYIQMNHNGCLDVLNMAKSDFKHLYEEYKLSISRKMSSAEKSAIDEIYHQLNKPISPVRLKTLKIDNSNHTSSNKDELMTLSNFIRVCDLSEFMIPDCPGIYAIRVIDVHDMPEPFNNELMNRGHDLLYIGIASNSLRERLWKEELNHSRPATFFRSIGAILGYKPIKGSLYGKNTRNYKFSIDDTESIKTWIRQHLMVSAIPCSNDLGSIETQLILKYKPIVNLSKNPYKMTEISDLRAECLKVAQEI